MGLLASQDERGVVTNDCQGCRGDRADRTRPKRRDTNREGVEDPGPELERKSRDEPGDRGEVEDRHDEGGPL